MKIKTTTSLLLLSFFYSCGEKQNDLATIQPTNTVELSTPITVIDANFPLQISELDFLNCSNELEVVFQKLKKQQKTMQVNLIYLGKFPVIKKFISIQFG